MPKSGTLHFYPRSPCGERHAKRWNSTERPVISIHALLAESDRADNIKRNKKIKFLSTLSLRRATREKPRQTRTDTNFYPRSPCGERRKPKDLKSRRIVFLSTLSLRRATISTALLILPIRFLSTLSLRRATAVTRVARTPTMISIHALLAESDC